MDRLRRLAPRPRALPLGAGQATLRAGAEGTEICEQAPAISGIPAGALAPSAPSQALVEVPVVEVPTPQSTVPAPHCSTPSRPPRTPLGLGKHIHPATHPVKQPPGTRRHQSPHGCARYGLPLRGGWGGPGVRVAWVVQ